MTHKCRLCGKKMERADHGEFNGCGWSDRDFNPIPPSSESSVGNYYCNNYRCPLSHNFRLYLTGKYEPEGQVVLWSGCGKHEYIFYLSNLKHNGAFSWFRDDDPGTLI